MLNSELHTSVIVLPPVMKLAQVILQNLEVCFIMYVMNVSKSTQLWTFSKAHFPLYTMLNI